MSNVRDTSLAAYFLIRGRGIDLNQRGRIYDWLRIYEAIHDKQPTRNEIAYLMGMRLSSVCGRVKEMIDDNWLSDNEIRKCSQTGMNDHVVKINK